MRRAFMLAATFSVASSLAGAATARAATQPSLIPVADTYVDASQPALNDGASTRVRVDGSPVVRSYLRFSVPPPPGPVTRATLRVYARSKSGTRGLEARSVSNAWGERTLTWANAPAPSATVTATTATFPANVWVPLDVTPLVAALGPGGGDVSIALGTPSSTAVTLSSRESGAQAPQLVLDTAAATPPVSTGPPAISGVYADGQTLTGTSGQWSGTMPISYAYQWRRCDPLTASCYDIPAAGAQTYTLGSADAGMQIQLAVTATNSAGSASATSAMTPVVAGLPPAEGSGPTISGTAVQAQTLTADPGSWSGTTPISYSYSWRRCDASGAGCTDIDGAGDSTYVLGDADVGATIRVLVTASNRFGSAADVSGATASVTALPEAPVNTTPPAISGSARDGERLTGEAGAWSGTAPISYAFQWQRCDPAAGGTCTDVGTNAPAYTLVSADVGMQIQLEVIATNDTGAGSATSSPTDPVAGNPPASDPADPPGVTGGAFTGVTLSAQNGTWLGSTPIAFSHQWQRCAADGTACADIAGATDDSYRAGSEDVGHTLAVVVTAINMAAPGGVSAQSAPTAVVELDMQPSLPIRAAFYYAWYPEAWTQHGLSPYTRYRPSLGFYDSTSSAVIGQHLRAMEYGKIDVAISSWWGQGTKTDNRFPLLLSNTASTAPELRWALYYEPEGTGDPPVEQIASDLRYIRDRYSGDRSYLRIGGRFVVFAYGSNDTCDMASRWKQAASGVGAYIVLKTVSGSASCPDQPDGWHQYAPGHAESPVSGAFTISPGFDDAGESAPRLRRDLTTWYQNVRDMVASNAPFQLVTTFNEWGEGTAVESADEWATSSGYGAYLDALHANGEAPPPATPTGLAATAGNRAVSLDWADDAEPDLAGYRVYRRSSDGTWPATPIATVTESVWSDSGLDNSTSYSYRVSAYNTAGNESVPSATVTATPVGAAVPDPVVAAAGDIACDPKTGVSTTTCQAAATSNLLVAMSPTAVVSLGDNQYDCAGYQAFLQRFDPTWGRLKSLIRPALGNHEYETGTAGTDCSAAADAAGYFDYFDGVGNQTGPAGERGKGYYSYDVGAWHLIALNANCSKVGGCGSGSPQEKWLRDDLAAHPSACTLAYWHQPRFTSGDHGNTTAVGAFWNDLYATRGEIVLNGHDHDYERFAPQTPGQVADANGIREFVVGTGGKSHGAFLATQPNSEVRNTAAYGVLKLTLHPNSYDWEFVPVAGQSFSDHGSEPCR